jgi:hypothetical protein
MGVIALPTLGFSAWIIGLHSHVNRPLPEEVILPLIPSVVSILELIIQAFLHKLCGSQLEGKPVHTVIVRGPTSSSSVGILLPVFYFALYFASVIRLSVTGNFRDCSEKNGLYLKLKR